MQRILAEDLPVVLVVDDDPSLRAYMCQCLARLPISTEQAATGRDALDRIRSDHQTAVSLVMADVHMPHIGGRELKEQLRNDERSAGLPVLLVTGDVLDAADRPFLRKPFNARVLCAAVQSLLGFHDETDSARDRGPDGA